MNWTRPQPRLLMGLSVAYMALLTVVIATQLFLLPVFGTIMEGEKMALGCFRTKTLLFGVDCHGFLGARVVQLLLDLPFILLVGPFGGIFELASFADSGDLKNILHGVAILAVTAALWTPVVYLFIQLRRATES